jgi:uncharacterized protein YggE
MHRARLALAVVGIVLLAGCVAPLQSTATNADDGEGTTVVTTGAGSVEADADLAVVRVAVVSVADTAEAARNDTASRSTALVDTLVAAGVPDDAITTASYSLNAQYDRDGGERELVGYRAVHAYRVEIAPDEAGSVVDAAVSEAGAEVWGVEFTLSPETRAELRAEAVENAVADARADANAAAAAAGLAVTRVVSIEVGSTPTFVSRGLETADAGTEFRPGPVTVEATVTVTYRAG